MFFLNIAHFEKKKNTKENDPDLAQKLSKVAFEIDLVHFLGCIFSKILYISKRIRDILDLFEVPKMFFF